MLSKLWEESEFRSGKCTPENWISFNIISHLYLPPFELCKLQIHAVGAPADYVWVYIVYQAKKGLYTGTIKFDLHKFCYHK